MSQYPPTPSFGGPYSYAQQWPSGSYATSNSSAPQDPNNVAPNAGVQALNLNAAVAFPAGPQLPGLGFPSGPLDPPYFNNQLSNSQYSASFFDSAHSSHGQQTTTQQFHSTFSSVPPVTTTSLQTLPSHMVPAQNTQGTISSISSDDASKEEGEVSDINESSGRDSTDRATRGPPARGRCGSALLPKSRMVAETGVSSQIHPVTTYHTEVGDGLPDKSPSNRDASESRMDTCFRNLDVHPC